jgi:hypothetical protein
VIVSFTGDDALVGRDAHRRAIGMFVVTEADVAAIRAVLNQGESCRPLRRRPTMSESVGLVGREGQIPV